MSFLAKLDLDGGLKEVK